MTEERSVRPRRSWLGIVVATMLGIAATVGVGWYQLLQAEKQAVLAEDERAKSVYLNLVSIVEEHILNDQPIDLPRLSRLIDQRRREENVATPVTVREVLEKAEFNILGSRYLAFERKQALKAIFDSLYADLATRSFAPYASETLNAELLNEIAQYIQDGKSTEALESLKRLQEAHERDVEATRSRRGPTSLQSPIEELLKDPGWLIITIAAYAALLIWVLRSKSVLLRLRQVLGASPSKEEVRIRVARYREAGLDDAEIIRRLQRLGVPTSVAWSELIRDDEGTVGKTEGEAPPNDGNEVRGATADTGGPAPGRQR